MKLNTIINMAQDLNLSITDILHKQSDCPTCYVELPTLILADLKWKSFNVLV